MRKVFFIYILLAILAAYLILASSCVTKPLYFVSSSGILTYDRHTGKLEILWEYQGKQDSLRRIDANCVYPQK